MSPLRAVVAIVAAAGLALGCSVPFPTTPPASGLPSQSPGTLPEPTGSSGPSGTDQGVVLLTTTERGTPGMDALSAGTLRAALRGSVACFWLGDDADHYSLVWPHGFSVDPETLDLLGPDGQYLARLNDSVELGGGSLPGQSAPEPCGGQVFLVASVVSVNGVPVNIGEGSLRLTTRPRGEPGACPIEPLEPLMLVKTPEVLALRRLSTEIDVMATWPEGFRAVTGDRVTIVDRDGLPVLTQGVEADSVRGVDAGDRIDVCGIGSVAW